MIALRIHIFVLCVTLFGYVSEAQNYVTPVRCDLTPPSPQSAAMQAVQTPEPDMLTGAVDISVPIYTIESYGYTLPITLQYHTNGIKVFDDPAPLGYGWMLQPALRATRTVLGRPDELYEFIGRDPQTYIEPEGACYMCIVNPDAQSKIFKDRFDSEHDVFTFSLPGKTLTRVLDMSSGSPVFIGANDTEYHVESTDRLATITVTDPMGNRHVFGKCYEYYYEQCGKKVNTAWALSEIICDNGKKITLDWCEVRHSAGAKSWLGGHSFMDKKDQYAWWGAEYGPEDFECDNSEQAIFSRINETEFFLQLNSITFAGGIVNFDYASTGTGPMLTSIKVNNGSENVKSYTLSYVDEWYTLLKKIDGGSGHVYEFDYNTYYGTTPLCSWAKIHSQDWWGYFNNKPGLDLTPNIEVKHYESVSNTDGTYRSKLGSADRSIDADAMQAMILKKIVWPTGGTISYTYETHKFAPTRQECNGEIAPKDDPYLSEGGGLRVSSITTAVDTDDSNSFTIKYLYPMAVVRAVPSAATFIDVKKVLVAHPNRETVHNKLKTELRQVNIMPISDYMRYDIGVAPLWYEKVTAVWPEGKIEVYHADVLSSEPGRPHVSFGKRMPSHQNYVYGVSPVRTKKIVYKSAGTDYAPVETIENIYVKVFGTRALTNYHIEREKLDLDTDVHNSPDVIDGRYPDPNDPNIVVNGAYSSYAYAINPWSVELRSTKTTTHTDNGDISQTVNYAYVRYTGLIASVTSQSSEGKTQEVSVGYPVKGNSAIENAMIGANCVGLPVSETITLGSATTQAWAEYVQTASGAIRQRRTSVVYGNFSDTLYSPVCEYNSIGLLVRATDADGIATDWQWDADGLYLASKSVSGLVTSYSHKPLVGLTSLTQPWGQVSTYAYDGQGRLAGVSVNGLGRLNDFAYTFGADNNSITATAWLDEGKSHSIRETYDNLGRKTLQLDEATGIAQRFAYDAMGRLSMASVPSTAVPSAHDYSLTAYEPSPAATVVSTTKAGSEWHEGNRSVTVRRLTNKASGPLSCPRYSIGSVGSISHHGAYAAGELMVEEVTDENGHVVRTYTNKSGLVVMTEEGDGVADMLRTRRIYDDFGRLRAVLPPSVADGGMRTSDPFYIKNCYEIGYDACGRQASTRNPGATSASEVRYSRAGRTVAEHSAPMAPGEWFVHFYDKRGREAYTALASLTDAQLASLQSAFSVAEYTGAPSCAGYTLIPAPPASMASALSAAYYDDYSFMQLMGEAAISQSSEARPGLQTGGYDGGLNCAGAPAGQGRYSVTRYDDWGRSVRTDAQTAKGVLTTFTSYDRAGNALVSRSRLTLAGGDTLALTVANEHDSAGRLTKWTARHGLKSASADLQYGAHGSVSKETFLNCASRTYEYDCRGWLTQVKTVLPRFTQHPFLRAGGVAREFYAEATGAAEEPQAALPGFEMAKDEEYVETILYAGGAHPRYDGTASAHVSTLGGRYDYSFDCHDRLVGAAYTAGSDAPDGEDFSAEYAYSETGAPLSVRRRGVISAGAAEEFGEMDRLSYSWDGALLESVSCEALGEDFYGRTGHRLSAAGGDAAFGWNSAGLLVSDSSRGIRSARHNWLGQPLEVEFADGSRVAYAYTCGGELLSVGRIPAGGGAAERTYCGAFVFEGDSLAMVNFGGGYFDGHGNPYYCHSDWQGSVTMVTDESHSLVQHTGYYPYGEPWREPSGQPYLYGAKERQRDGGLNEYDHSARRLNSALALWTAPDPLALSYAGTSPYAYCASNPIKYTDPSGKNCVVLVVDSNPIGHMAMLIQNEEGKYQYYSVNGNNFSVSGKFLGGRKFNDVAVGSWDSAQDFLDSSYNTENGEKGKEDPSICGYEYKKGFEIETSIEEDAAMAETFSELSNTKYNPLYNNCVDAVQKSLEAGNINSKIPGQSIVNNLLSGAVIGEAQTIVQNGPIFAFLTIVALNYDIGDIVKKKDEGRGSK